MQYPFGNWRPDEKTVNAGLCETAEGVIPVPGGWGTFPQLVAASGAEALSAEPRGLVSIQKASGSWVVYGATGTTIEVMDAAYQWSDVETGRTVTTGDDVSFARMGTKLINTDTTSGMKAWDVESGGTNSAISGALAARAVVVINNTLFGLGSSANPRRMQNSDTGNYAKWSGGASDGKTMEDGGAFVGGVELTQRSGILFQDRKIRSVTFGVGAANYALDVVADDIGCVAERTIASINATACWWDSDGPWMVTPGSAPVSIGVDKINNWAADNIGRLNFKNLVATVDPGRNLIMWRVDSTRILCCDLRRREFSILPASTATLARIAVPAATINSLSGTINELTGSIDTLGGGSAPVLGGLNLSRKFATFSGTNMAIALEGRPVNNPVTGLVGWATPVDDFASGTLQVGVSDSLSGDLTWKTGQTRARGGRVPLRARGMNIAFRRNVPAGATGSFVNGVDHIQSAAGGPK